MILSRCKETAVVASSLEDYLVLLSFCRFPAPASFSLAHLWGELEKKVEQFMYSSKKKGDNCWIYLNRMKSCQVERVIITVQKCSLWIYVYETFLQLDRRPLIVAALS